MTDVPHTADAPRRHLGALHATVLALGMIMTTDTLKTAPTVALNIGTWHFYGTWVLGGLVSIAAPQFLTTDNLSQVAVQAAIIAVAAVGEALVILTRNV